MQLYSKIKSINCIQIGINNSLLIILYIVKYYVIVEDQSLCFNALNGLHGLYIYNY